MESEANRWIATALMLRVGQGVDAGQIADQVVSTWQAIDAALQPIIGQGGVAALYRRSLFLAGPSHPWMSSLHEGVPATLDLAALKDALARQGSAEAAAGGAHMLQTFHELLTSLVGPSLTERLLRSVWANFSIDSSARENSA